MVLEDETAIGWNIFRAAVVGNVLNVIRNGEKIGVTFGNMRCNRNLRRSKIKV